MTRRAFLAMLAVLAAALPARAEDGPEQHRGFLYRNTVGGGYSFVAAGGQRGHGAAVPLRFDFGGAVVENVILRGGFEYDFGIQEDRSDFGLTILTGIGAGVTWYLMPDNVYLDADLGVAVTITDPAACLFLSHEECHEIRKDDRTAGVFVGLGAGHEWWVSANWALGLGLRVTGGFSPDATLLNVLLAMTATYN